MIIFFIALVAQLIILIVC